MQPTPEQIEQARVIVNKVSVSTEDVIREVAAIIADAAYWRANYYHTR